MVLSGSQASTGSSPKPAVSSHAFAKGSARTLTRVSIDAAAHHGAALLRSPGPSCRFSGSGIFRALRVTVQRRKESNYCSTMSLCIEGSAFSSGESYTTHLCPPIAYPQTQLHDRITGELLKKAMPFKNTSSPVPLRFNESAAATIAQTESTRGDRTVSFG